jgi:hypothetical protein
MNLLTTVQSRILFKLLIISSFFLASCSKDIEADPIALAKASLIGNATSPSIWRLIEVKENGVLSANNPINNRSTNFFIRFYQGGSFHDSEGVVGKWDMPNPQTLSTTCTNMITGAEVSQTYTVEVINNILLKMNYTYQGKTISLVYVTAAK